MPAGVGVWSKAMSWGGRKFGGEDLCDPLGNGQGRRQGNYQWSDTNTRLSEEKELIL